MIQYITAINAGYIPFLENFLHFAPFMRPKLFVYAFDDDVVQYCAERYISHFLLNITVSRELETFKTPKCKKITQRGKILSIYTALTQFKSNILFIDTDIILFMDPTKYLETFDSDILCQCDEDTYKCREPCQNICSGFILYKNVPHIISFMKTLVEVSDEFLEQFTGDQRLQFHYMNTLGIQPKTLPKHLFPNGSYLKMTNWQKTPLMYLMHFNYLLAHQKIPKMKELGYWKEVFKKISIQYTAKKRSIQYITAINAGYIPFLENFLHFAPFMRSKLFVYAFDDEVVQYCAENMIRHSFLEIRVTKNLATFGDKDYFDLVNRGKPLSIYTALKQFHHDIVFIDTDIIVFKDPTEYLEYTSCDIVSQCDEDLISCSDFNYCKNICSGFIMFRNIPKIHSLFKELVEVKKEYLDLLPMSEKHGDQRLLLHFIKKFNICRYTVPHHLFPNGAYLKMTNWKYEPDMYLMHFNYLYAHEKISKMKKLGYWKKQVVIDIHGGLGNQLFLYAAGQFYSRRLGREHVIASIKMSDHTPNSIADFFNLKITPELQITDVDTCEELETSKADVVRPLYSWKTRYFQKYMYTQSIMHLFPLAETYKKAFIHFRGGDYKTNTGFSHSLMNYYRNALLLFDRDTEFVVFTNDKEFALEHIKKLDISYSFDESVNEMDALREMSKCSIGGITANSTFSYWGAIMNPNRILTIPWHWFAKLYNIEELYDGPFYVVDNHDHQDFSTVIVANKLVPLWEKPDYPIFLRIHDGFDPKHFSFAKKVIYTDCSIALTPENIRDILAEKFQAPGLQVYFNDSTIASSTIKM